MRFTILALILLVSGCNRPAADPETSNQVVADREAGPAGPATTPPTELPDSIDAETICTDVAYAALLITVIDAETGVPIREGVAGVASEDNFVDTLTFLGRYRPGPGEASSSLLSGVYERPGTYAVTVHHPDYETWQRDGIAVASDECHVIPRTLEARLSPISP